MPTKKTNRGRIRANGDGALYYVPSRKLWKGVLDIGYWPDGRRRQKSVTSRTQQGAREKLDLLKREIREHGAPLDKQTTVSEWADHWLETVCRPKLKPNALQSYESLTRSWIIPTIGKKKVALLKPSDVRLVIQAINAKGLSTATARKCYVVLSGMLEAARLDALAARNVANDVTPPRVLKAHRAAIETEDAFKMLRAASEQRDGTRWWAAILEGLRQSERLGAQIADMDLDRGVYTVQWQLSEVPFEHGCLDRDRKVTCGFARAGSCPSRRLRIPDAFEYRQLDGRLCLIRPKSGKPREVPLVPAFVVAMRRYLEETKDVPNPHGLVWRHDDGSPILAGEDEQSWRDLMLAAGVITKEQALPPRQRPATAPAPMTSHSARHTTVTVLMELGVDTKIIGEIVGHVDEETTGGYKHVSSAAAREAMAKVGEHFAAALTGG